MPEIALVLAAHAVLSEFVDVYTGDRITPPGDFTPRDTDQKDRLIASRCISKEPIVNIEKPVEDMNRQELEAAITASFIASMASATDDDLRTGIGNYRKKLAGDQVDTVDDGLDDRGVTVANLQEIAAKEEVDLTGITIKADIIKAIRDSRMAKLSADA